LLLAAVVGLTVATPARSAYQECWEHASGHGSYIAGTNEEGKPIKRQFSFNAIEHRDGTVTGNAVIHNPAFEFRGHLEISCLRVTPVDLNNDGTIDATRADIGGTVRNTNDPNLDGLNGFFTVFDYGEPSKGTDTISPVFFGPPDQPPTSACEFILGDPTAPSNIIQIPIDTGNIQARDCPGDDL
jgi:hypothetical protein